MIKRLMFHLRNWTRERTIKRYKKQADRLHLATGKQYFVVPVENWQRGEYTIVNNEAHKLYNKQAKKQGKPTINFKQLCEIAIYKTKAGSL